MSLRNIAGRYGIIAGPVMIIIPVLLMSYLEKNGLADSVGYPLFYVMVFGIVFTIGLSIRFWRKSIIYKVAFFLTLLFSAFIGEMMVCVEFYCPEWE